MLRVIYIILFLIHLVLNTAFVSGQDVNKGLHVGEIWHSDESIPSGGWQVGYNWPGNVVREHFAGSWKETMLANGTARMAGMSAGLKNWKDRRGNIMPYLIYSVSESIIAHTHSSGYAGGEPISMKVTFRERPPAVFINGKADAPRHTYDEIDPTLVSDAKMEIRWVTPMGLTFQQDYYAYAAENGEDYFIVDFHALNNGQIDKDSQVELTDNFIEEIYFNYGIQPFMGFQGAEQNYTLFEDRNDDWVEYYGENYEDYIGSGTPVNPAGDSNADSLRVFIVWDGDDKLDAEHGELDDTGDPNNNKHWSPPSPPLGTLLSPQYFGMGILHADQSALDESNDLSQPATAVWYPAMLPSGWTKDKVYNYFFAGDGSVNGEDWTAFRPSPQELGFTNPNDQQTVARPNPYVGIGPYEIPMGEEVHWTMVIGVNGISRDKCIEYGVSNWEYHQGYAGLTDEQKNAMVATGRDSLMKTIGMATWRYFNNVESGRDPFDLPDPPAAPDLYVNAGIKSVILSWSDVSNAPDFDTGELDFAGYRVYRTQGLVYNSYDMIWDSAVDGGYATDTSFVDTTVQRGFAYFYYVTAYDDGTQNWENPSQSLESGKYWNMMQRLTPVYPFLSAENAQSKLIIDRNMLQIQRWNAGGSTDTIGLSIPLDIPVDESTKVQFDLKVLESTIPVNSQGNYPLYFSLDVELDNTTEVVLKYAYDSRAGSNYSSDTLTQVVRSVFIDSLYVEQSFNIREHLPSAAKITKMWVGGSGWDFESNIDNIVISSDNETHFYEDFNDGDYTANPAWDVSNLPETKAADLNEVLVVPNPYHDKSTKNNWPGEPNKIMFVNIPGNCTIRIYTATGDLVTTIDHYDGTSEASWNQVTDNNQLVFSGVYIFHITSSYGSKVGKFVIIRTSTAEEREMGIY